MKFFKCKSSTSQDEAKKEINLKEPEKKIKLSRAKKEFELKEAEYIFRCNEKKLFRERAKGFISANNEYEENIKEGMSILDSETIRQESVYYYYRIFESDHDKNFSKWIYEDKRIKNM